MYLPLPFCNTPQGAFKGTINDDDDDNMRQATNGNFNQPVAKNVYAERLTELVSAKSGMYWQSN